MTSVIAPQSPARPGRWRALVAPAVALAGVMTLASSLSANVPWRTRVLDSFVPQAAQDVAHAAGVIGGIALLGLSWGLLRGRRRAGPAAVAVLAVLAVIHAAKGLDYEEASIALVLAALLWLALRAASPERRPPRALLAALAAAAALAGAYAVTLTAVLVDGRSPGVGPALARAAHAVMTGQAGPLDEDVRRALHVLVGLAVLALAVAARALLAPARAADGHDAAEHTRAAAIVARHGTDSLAPFVLRADKAFFFAHGGVLAYRTLRETAVVSGDPVGPPGAAPAIMADFLAYAGERGWDVVATAAGPEHLEGYRALGLRTMQIGSEAIVDPQRFSLEGRRIRKVRQSVHRIARRGWTVTVVRARELEPALIAELADAERRWSSSRVRRGGFAMAMDRLWGAPEDAGDVYVLGRDPDGRLRAFLRFVTHRDGLSLDAMRRLGGEPNGLNEALVCAGLEHARAAGVQQVSLNFAGFAHVMAADALASGRRRVLRWALRLLHGRFQFERLVRFNDKFFPAWRPRFLVYTGQTRFPLAALRVLQVESYLRCPRARAPRAAWAPGSEPIGAALPVTGGALRG